MKVLIVLSTVVVVAWAQYGSVAADPSTATQVQYQYAVNPYPGNYYYEQYGPYYRHPRNHHRRRHHPRPHHHHHHDSDSSEEDYNGWGWANDGFEGIPPPPYYGYPPIQPPVIFTVPAVVASDPASYGTASDSVAAAPATYGSK